MKRFGTVIFLLTLTQMACSSTPKTAGELCGEGEGIDAGEDVACVYRSELIEEGFTCPSVVPVGFLLEGGGVACVENERMPEGLGEELEGRGHGPQNPECFGDDPPPACYLAPPLVNNGMNNGTNNGTNNETNNGTNNGTPNAMPAFSTADAEFLEYRTGPGLGYCIEEGDLLGFSVEVSSLRASASVAVAGSEGEPSCIEGTTTDTCLIAEERNFDLTQAELDALIALLDAVPAPMCELDPGLACDPCFVETLEVDSDSVPSDCCGEQKAVGLGESFTAVVEYMRSLVPTPFTANATTFATLTYTALPGDGYCIADGDILSGTLERQTDGSLSLEGESAVAADAATETCIPSVTTGACLKAQAFGPMTLAQTDTDTLEGLLAALPAPMCVEEDGLVCDPCLVETVTVDGVATDGGCCGTTRHGYDDAFAALAAHIQTLR